MCKPVICRTIRFALLVILLSGVAGAYPIRSSFLKTLESNRCGDSHQANELALVWSPQKAAPFPVLDANCVAEFSSHLQSREDREDLGAQWAVQRANCHQTAVLQEVPSLSGGKSKLCGVTCEHGRPVKFCTY